jgi:hypothetical protein
MRTMLKHCAVTVCHARRPPWRGSLSSRARIGSTATANASAPLSAAAFITAATHHPVAPSSWRSLPAVAIPPVAPCGWPYITPPASGP